MTGADSFVGIFKFYCVNIKNVNTYQEPATYYYHSLVKYCQRPSKNPE